MPIKRTSYLSCRNRRGFTLIEAVVVLAIISAVFVVGTPKIAGVIVKAKVTQCLANRVTWEKAEERYRTDNDGRPSSGPEALKAARYIDRVPMCTAGGSYVWISTSSPVKMGCSIHEWPVVDVDTSTIVFIDAVPVVAAAPGPLTPLGSTFGDISEGFMALIKNYRTSTGNWPSDSYPRNFTDLGLQASDWSAPVDHLIYSPAGVMLKIRPEAGWNITVTSNKGKTLAITQKNGYNLVYNASNLAWYYKEVSSSNLVRIATMKVVPA